MISLVFIVGFFSFFLLPITCLSILFSLQQPHRGASVAVATTEPHLSSIFTLLLHHTLFPKYQPHSAPPNKVPCNDHADNGVRRYAAGGEAEECGVCLCEVEQGEEISDLRCNHLFHRACLDAWVGSGRPTCPLCRGSVFSPAVAEEGGADVLIFRFMSNSRRAARREDTWWLR